MATENEHYDEEFKGGDLSGIGIAGAEFNGCRFEGCDLSEADLSAARFLECSFVSCNLSNVVVRNATFRDVSFTDCKAVGLDWTTASTIQDLVFDRCVLNYSNFTELDLRGLRISHCTAHEVSFTGSNLSKADLTGTDLRRSELSGANLTEADFRGAVNYRVRPGDVRLKKTRFSLPEATSLLDGLDIILDDAPAGGLGTR